MIGKILKHTTCIIITLSFLLLAIFVFGSNFERVLENCRDAGTSLATYFVCLFRLENITISDTVNLVPANGNYDLFIEEISAYWSTIIDVDNIANYFKVVGVVLLKLLQVMSITLLPVVVLVMLVKHNYDKITNTNKHNKDTNALKFYKKRIENKLKKISKGLASFIAFIKNNKCYKKIWLIIWLYNLNVITIGLGFFAYVLYISSVFNFSTFGIQMYKLISDLYVPFNYIPFIAWVILGIVLILWYRVKRAKKLLNYLEIKNKEYLERRPIFFELVGTMGMKKTTGVSDMALSYECIFRAKAFELMLSNDMKFPQFPWINLEDDLIKQINDKVIYNLKSARDYIYSKALRFINDKVPANIYDYDIALNPLSYNNELEVVNIWQVLESYAQLFFIYLVESSLIISNYSIRTDNMLTTAGNLPLWDLSFFERDSKLQNSYSRHSHIIDFDMLRLQKKLNVNNLNADYFEFGVVALTEIGKERGNMLENQGKKMTEDVANQKNDGFAKALKMIRHPSTVDYYPFCAVIADEQRASSLGADLRELAEVITIKESSRTKLAMPFFFVEELIYAFLYKKFKKSYVDYRYRRGDNSLIMYLYKKIACKFINYYKRIYNLYGYSILETEIEDGKLDGEKIEENYFLSNKKIYSNRFATDCYRGFYEDRLTKCKAGINDVPEYTLIVASIDELEAQNSYFIRDISSNFKSD